MRPHRTAAPVTLVALPVLLLTGCGLGPATTFTEDVALTGDVRTVAVDSGSGDVTVRHDPAAAEPRLVRRVEYRGTAPGATTRQDDDRLALDGCPGSCSVDYELTLPDQDAAVTGVLGSGDAEISGVATVDLELGSGGTRLRDVTGPVTLDVGSGDVRGEGLSGDADVGSSSGTVRLAFAVPASARVRASSGDVEVTVPRADYAVVATTGSGEVRDGVGATPGAPHTLDLGTGSGDVVLGFGG